MKTRFEKLLDRFEVEKNEREYIEMFIWDMGFKTNDPDQELLEALIKMWLDQKLLKEVKGLLKKK